MKNFLLLVFFVGTVGMVFVMAKTGASLKTAATPLGILDLEFAYNTEKVSAVMNAWAPAGGQDNIAKANSNTRLDFIFIFFYAGFLFLACKGIAAALKGPVSKAGIPIGVSALVAGFFDVLENAGMLLTLNGHSSGSIAFLTSFFSSLKWVLALVAVLYLATGLLVWIYYKLWNPNP